LTSTAFLHRAQQENPELRGKPVIVVPTMAETTCAIAASYSAKAFGIKTGTLVHEAWKLSAGNHSALAAATVVRRGGWMRACLGAVVYFAVVFGVGFAFGPLRVLFLEPRVGSTVAVLIESPVLLAAMDQISRRHWRGMASRPACGLPSQQISAWATKFSRASPTWMRISWSWAHTAIRACASWCLGAQLVTLQRT
jgi:hypothetical protein